MASVQLSPEARALLRDALAGAIVKAKAGAMAEAAAWQARALAAETQASTLREEVLAQLEVERAPEGAREALDAVSRVCRPLADDACSHASFLRQVRVVQAVRALSTGAASVPRPVAGRAAPAEVIDVAVQLLASMGAEEPPKHAQAFLDAAFRYLCACSVPVGGRSPITAASEELCALLAQRDSAVCICRVLCRLARQPAARGGSGALLLAAAEKLRDAAEACACVVRVAASRPFAAPIAAEEAEAEADAQRQYETAYFLVRIVEACLGTFACVPCEGDERARALAVLEAFARVHAHAQRCAEPLRARFGLLSCALWRVTAGANTVALRLLTSERE